MIGTGLVQRNQVELGVQQGFGKWVVVDVGYFNKRTDNGYDFSILFNTPIVFPVSWDHSRIDGFTGRINQAFDRLRRGYGRVLDATLSARPAVYIVWLVLSALAVPMYLQAPSELAPPEAARGQDRDLALGCT